MFGIGMPELVMIFVVALIVLGPKRLPEAARTLARALAEFRRATSGIGDELDSARRMLEDEVRAAEREIAARPIKAPEGAPVARGAAEPVPAAEDEASAAAVTTTRPPGEPAV